MIIEPKKTCKSCHWRVSEFCNLLKLGVQKTTPACRGYREAQSKEEREAHVFSDSPSMIHVVVPDTSLEFTKVKAAKQSRKANRLFLKTLVERNVLDDSHISQLSRLANSFLKTEQAKESASKGEI